MNRTLLLCCCLSLLFFACKTASIGTGKKLRKRSPKYILEQVEAQRINFEWVKAKAKAKVVTEDQNVSFVIKLRMRKDSLVWLQLKKVSVEGLRVQMNPDRIQVLNRQDNQYIVEPFSSIKKQLAIPFDFQTVEDLLVGNPIMYQQIDFKSKIDSGYYYMEGDIPDPDDASLNLGKLRFWLNEQFQIVRLEAEMGENQVQALFSDYEEVEGRTLAMTKDIRMQSPESGKVRMKITFNKIEFDKPASMNFSIPEHYEKIINGVKQ